MGSQIESANRDLLVYVLIKINIYIVTPKQLKGSKVIQNIQNGCANFMKLLNGIYVPHQYRAKKLHHCAYIGVKVNSFSTNKQAL